LSEDDHVWFAKKTPQPLIRVLFIARTELDGQKIVKDQLIYVRLRRITLVEGTKYYVYQ
jgi:hypothetical protein